MPLNMIVTIHHIAFFHLILTVGKTYITNLRIFWMEYGVLLSSVIPLKIEKCAILSLQIIKNSRFVKQIISYIAFFFTRSGIPMQRIILENKKAKTTATAYRMFVNV